MISGAEVGVYISGSYNGIGGWIEEALIGLGGQRLTEGLAGQWIQPYWLWLAVNEAGGRLDVAGDEGRVGLIARIPA